MESQESRPTVLIIDDESAIVDTLRILLKNEGFAAHVAFGGKQGLDQIAAIKPDIIISDIRMPAVGGLDVLSAAKAQDPDVPVILMTAQASLQSAISAVNDGAFHYVQKPFQNDALVAIVRRAAETRQLKTENRALKREIKRRDSGLKPIGTNRAWLDVLNVAETVATSDSTVLLQVNRARARAWSPDTFTSCQGAHRDHSYRSTAARFPRVFSRVSCLDT